MATHPPPTDVPPVLNNAEIAHRLRSLAQLLSAQGENPFKIRAYRRAADTVEAAGESVAAWVRQHEDLTRLPGVGQGIASAIQEIVQSGSLRRLDTLRREVAPEIAALSEYPRLDPKRIQQIYRQLHISTVAELRERLEAGVLGREFGPRIEHHVRRALTPAQEILLYDADDVAAEVGRFLRERCRVAKCEPAGDYRRRVEIIGELVFVIVTANFPRVVAAMAEYGGESAQVREQEGRVTFRLPNGLLVTLENTTLARWGLALLSATGGEAHLEELEQAGRSLRRLDRRRIRLGTEISVYRALGLKFIPPELRNGTGEVELARTGTLPRLVALDDVRGDLHAHTTASDGASSLEQMAAAAAERGYEYLGLTDHSQSLKIAGGVSESDLRAQIRRIDRFNARQSKVRLLKSAEVDIRADGTLDYPDELLRQLDYTVCSIHSKFGLDRAAQTARILRAMDNPHFTILGHATGRLLLRRPGYDLDFERIIAHARDRGCFFEINASPDRLDLSADNARLAHAAGIKIAVCTDAHSVHELDYLRCGLDQARRAGLRREDVLNCLPARELERVFRAVRR